MQSKRRLEDILLPLGVHRLGARTASVSSAPIWRLEEVAGRLIEISGQSATAALTCALGLVLDAQRHGEPVAWVSDVGSSFYPPDAADSGVDLEALVVVRVPATLAIPRAADQLARSGAFGLLVLDLGMSPCRRRSHPGFLAWRKSTTSPWSA